MKMNIKPFPSCLFTFYKNSFIAEASDLGNRHLERLYDDACDVGLAIRSIVTGKTVTFYMEKPIYRGDGEDVEVVGWEYLPTTESIRQVPGCANKSVVVFND